jgi:hypothetical protein
MSDKLKIMQHFDLHRDREMGKTRHEEDHLWNFFPYVEVWFIQDEYLHETYDAPPRG